jgi:hypothetical protein
VLAVPGAWQNFSQQVVHIFRRKLPTANSMSNQPALWTWCIKISFTVVVLLTSVHLHTKFFSCCCIKCSNCSAGNIGDSPSHSFLLFQFRIICMWMCNGQCSFTRYTKYIRCWMGSVHKLIYSIMILFMEKACFFFTATWPKNGVLEY